MAKTKVRRAAPESGAVAEKAEEEKRNYCGEKDGGEVVGVAVEAFGRTGDGLKYLLDVLIAAAAREQCLGPPAQARLLSETRAALGCVQIRCLALAMQRMLKVNQHLDLHKCRRRARLRTL